MEHPFYGVRRLALHLDWSAKKTRRIRNLAGIVIPIASRGRRYRPGEAQTEAPANILGEYATFKDSKRPQDGRDYGGMTATGAWSQDFTYLRLRGSFYYLGGCDGSQMPAHHRLAPGRQPQCRADLRRPAGRSEQARAAGDPPFRPGQRIFILSTPGALPKDGDPPELFRQRQPLAERLRRALLRPVQVGAG